MAWIHINRSRFSKLVNMTKYMRIRSTINSKLTDDSQEEKIEMMITRVIRTASRRVLTPVQALGHDAIAMSPRDFRSSQTGAGANSAVLALAALVAAGSVAVFSSSSADSSSSCEAADAPVYLSSAEEFLYPAIQPYNTGMLKVSDKHTLYYEECGNPQGKVRPAL